MQLKLLFKNEVNKSKKKKYSVIKLIKLINYLLIFNKAYDAVHSLPVEHSKEICFDAFEFVILLSILCAKKLFERSFK